jgi:hypothetical protein
MAWKTECDGPIDQTSHPLTDSKFLTLVTTRHLAGLSHAYGQCPPCGEKLKDHYGCTGRLVYDQMHYNGVVSEQVLEC